MTIGEFVLKAMEQDKRNVFKKCEELTADIPEILVPFFKEANPVDVEVSIGGKAIRFYQVEELGSLQRDYNLPGGRYAFATCNSDPIYLLEGRVYTCCHGISIVKDEEISGSLEQFLNSID